MPEAYRDTNPVRLPGNRRKPTVDASQLGRLSFSFGPYSVAAPGEPPQDFRSDLMDKKKLEAFKKRLETRQQDLRRTVSRTQADGRSADEDTAQDIADRAASSYTKEFLFSQSNNERRCCRWWSGRWRASAKAASASASIAVKRSMPSDWRRCPGRGTASSARRSWSRDCWRRLRGRTVCLLHAKIGAARVREHLPVSSGRGRPPDSRRDGGAT